MKKAPLYISIATAVIGISAFTFFDHSAAEEANPSELMAASSNMSKPVPGPVYAAPRASCMDYKRLYSVRKRYTKRITKTQIKEAKLINDFLPHYPGGWMAEYISVKIIGDVKGQTKMAVGPDNHITAEQRELLNTLEPLDGIAIQIRYKAENSITGEMESSKMEYAMGVVPDVDAEYLGGEDELVNYLADNTWDIIRTLGFDQSKNTAIRFTINREGKPENIAIFIESGNDTVDKVLKEAVANMPPWKPAQNFTGEKAKQQFEFILGDGC